MTQDTFGQKEKKRGVCSNYDCRREKGEDTTPESRPLRGRKRKKKREGCIMSRSPKRRERRSHHHISFHEKEGERIMFGEKGGTRGECHTSKIKSEKNRKPFLVCRRKLSKNRKKKRGGGGGFFRRKRKKEWIALSTTEKTALPGKATRRRKEGGRGGGFYPSFT